MKEKNNSAEGAKRLPVSDLIPRILCIALALVIWLYVMSNESPDYERTFSGVSVEVENAALLMSEKNLSVINGYGSLADITVTGKKSDVISYSLEDIIARVDVSSIDEAGRHQLTISVATPDGCVLKSIYPTSVEVYADELATKTIPVKVNIKSVQYDQSISLGALTPDVSAVTVSGPASAVDAIDAAVVDLDLGTVTTSVTARGTLKTVNGEGIEISNPYLVLSQSSVGVSVPVYIEKSVPITVNMKHGYLTSDNSLVSVTPRQITVRADPKLLEGVESFVVATVDETKIGDDMTQIVTINLPSGVENVSGSDTASIAVRHRGTVKKSLAISSIVLENPNGLKYTVIGDSVNVTFRVPTALADELLPEDFSVVGELSYNGITGIVQVPLTVSVPSKYSGDVYAIGEYTITVNIGQ